MRSFIGYLGRGKDGSFYSEAELQGLVEEKYKLMLERIQQEGQSPEEKLLHEYIKLLENGQKLSYEEFMVRKGRQKSTRS